LYYITDYITKSQLQAHVAYAALKFAVQRLREYDSEKDEMKVRAKKLLQKCAHSLISKQELSAQQVVSYLMDFEDHFTSHEYTQLFWCSFESLIDYEDPSPECYPKKNLVSLDASVTAEDEQDASGEDVPEDDLNSAFIDDDPDLEVDLERTLNKPVFNENDQITVTTNKDGKLVPSANQVCDYQHRGPCLAHVNIWDFVAQTKKEKRPAIDDEVSDTDSEDKDMCESDDILDNERHQLDQVNFLSHHLESKTHSMRVNPYLRCKVPVPIGPAIPRRNAAASIEKHVRLMLILFEP
jgi:hypothetical protein